METEFIYSKITKVSGSKKGAVITITDQYLNDFVGKNILVRVELIKKKSLKNVRTK